jgi:hypothetical protein
MSTSARANGVRTALGADGGTDVGADMIRCASAAQMSQMYPRLPATSFFT